MSALLLLAGVVFVALSFAGSERELRQVGASWRQAAERLKLRFEGAGYSPHVSGELGGVPVDARFSRTLVSRRRSSSRTTLRAGGDGSIPASLRVHPASLSRLAPELDSSARLGDRDFDDAVWMPGLDAFGCAALSLTAREELLKLLALGGEARAGWVSWESTEHLTQDPAWLTMRLEALARLASLLKVTPDSLHQRLADNALHDPCWGVRLRNFRFLIAPRTRTPRELVVTTARSLLAARDADLRLLAAQQLGIEARPVLAALAASDTEASALRLAALRSLNETGAPALELLRPLLREGDPALRREALAIAAQRELGELAAEVLGCARDQDAALRAAAARALGQLRAPEAEQVLIGMLRDARPEVQAASAEALAAAGSVVAVEPLLELAGGFGRAALRQAAGAAIGRIQSRLGNVEAGSLSLAESEQLAGAVELAEPEARDGGELSLASESAAASARRS